MNMMTDDNQCNDNKCDHLETTKDGGMIICLDCGEETDSVQNKDDNCFYYERYQARTYNQITIQKDVANMNINKIVTDVADEYFKILSKDHGPFKNHFRKSIIFACVYFAKAKVDKKFDTNQLINSFGIKKKRALNGLKFVQLNIPSDIELYKPVIKASDIVRNTMMKFNASEDQIRHVMKLCDELFENGGQRTEALIRARTSSVAKSLVYLYIVRNGINIPLKKFSKIVGLTEKTITDVMSEISKIF